MDAQENEERYPSSDEVIQEIIKANLKFLRKKSKLTQKEFVEPLLISDKILSRYEQKGTAPVDFLLRVCNTYHVSIEDLLTRRLEETSGITTTDNLLTDLEKSQLNEALSEAVHQKHGEEVDSFEYGTLSIRYNPTFYSNKKNWHTLEIPFRDLQNMFQEAEGCRNNKLKASIRAAIDSEKYRLIMDASIERTREMAEILHIDFDTYAEKYELLWTPLLQYCQMDTPLSAPQKNTAVFHRCQTFMPFRTVEDIIFIQYFTGNNPLTYIQDELVEIHNRTVKGEIFPPTKLYEKANIAVFGANYHHDPFLREWMQNSRRRIDCFQNISQRYEPSKFIDKIFLETVIPRDVDEFDGVPPQELHNLLAEPFIEYHGNRGEIHRRLCRYARDNRSKRLRDLHGFLEPSEESR